MARFVIHDERHDEEYAAFENADQAMAELHRLAELPWDGPPN